MVKIEESESKWPARRHVVACAGVCKSWREVIMGLVKTLEVSGRITSSLTQESLVSSVKRNHSNQTYLFASLSQALGDDGKFLLAARKCMRATYTDYTISLHADDISKGSSTYIGKLRSNFLATKFVACDALTPDSGAKMAKSQSTRSKQISPRIPAGNYPVAHISYELHVLGARGPKECTVLWMRFQLLQLNLEVFLPLKLIYL